MFAVAAPGGARGESALFPRPAAMEPQVRFWRSIFTEYGAHQVVVHDTLHLDRVYAVLEVDPDVDSRREAGYVIERLRATLRRLHQEGARPGSLDPEERRIVELLRDDPSPDRFLAAAAPERMRTQRGLRERFGEGVRVSRTYLPVMEEIFREEGLPVELTRLPLIESCFDVRAHSKVGASGIWQFMPSTGRLFMRVDDLVDERRDPIKSTRAAAAFLRRLYARLGTWPLAITAYNHGPEGIARAVRATGSADIATIVREYDGRAFGFASRNFYAEFLAALDVDAGHRVYFGEQVTDPPLATREFRLEQPLGIEAAARLAGTDREEVARLNPALSDVVVGARRAIPAGYRLRLPASGAAGFEDRFAEYAAEVRVTRVAAPTVRSGGEDTVGVATHRVRSGQTLSEIARYYGVSVGSLLDANALRRPEELRAGQVIRIPAPGVKREARTHRVRRGQTLSQIAEQYKVSVSSLRSTNRINRPSQLRAGQVIRIPAM
jgi:membrane-bound lytic murein transglycosylase D